MHHSTNDDNGDNDVTSFSKTRSLSDLCGSDNYDLPPPYPNSSRVQQEPNSSTLSKLRYDAIAFVGRNVESEILRSRLQRVATRTTCCSGEEEEEEEEVHCGGGPRNNNYKKKEMVLLRGWSGVGKSCLSNRLQGWMIRNDDELDDDDKGLFVKGKYELTSKTPYSGIAQAIGAVCQEAKRKLGDDAELNIGNRLVSELGSEVQLIKKLIPELRMILPKDKEEEMVSVQDGINGFEAGMERWKHVFRVLVRILALKDYETAAFLAEIGIKVQRKTGSKYDEASTLYVAAFAAMTWRQPLQDCSNLMLEAYSAGMKSGNTVYGVWSLCVHSIIFPFVLLGKPLGPTLTAGTRSIPITEEARQEEQVTSSRLFCQTIANLMGKSDQTTLLQGEWFDSVGWAPPLQLEAGFHFLRLALFIYFDDFEAAAEIALTSGDTFEKKASGCFMVPPENFLRGVALYAMTRRTGKWRYKREAQKILAKFERWVQYGNPNVKAYHCMLQAEQAAFRKKHKDAESFYKEAVIIAARTGQLHVAGLGSERLADFLLIEKQDLDESLYQKKQAIRFYSEWGANAVVKRIQDDMASGSTASQQRALPKPPQ